MSHVESCSTFETFFPRSYRELNEHEEFTRLRSTNSSLKRDKYKLTMDLEKANESLQQGQAENAQLIEKNSLLLEECTVGAMAAVCDQMQSEKLETQHECLGDAISDGTKLAMYIEEISAKLEAANRANELLESEKKELLINYENAALKIQEKSAELNYANRLIKKLKDEVEKMNAQENGSTNRRQKELSEGVWHKRDAVVIKDQCDEFKDSFDLLHGAITSFLRNGIMAYDEKVLAENLSIAGKLAEKASSIRDRFKESTGTYVECIKGLLDELAPCDDSANSVTTENSEFEVVKE